MPLNIRWRLTAWYGGVLAVILLGLGIGVYLMMRHSLLARVDASLGDELAEAQEDAADSAKTFAQVQADLQRRSEHHEGYVFEVSRLDATEPGGSQRGDRAPLPKPKAAELLSVKDYYTETIPLGDAGRYRVSSRAVATPYGKLLIQVARPLAFEDQELRELSEVLLIAGGLGFLTVVAGGYFLAVRALAPVERMRSSAAEISARRLDQRIPIANANDELGRLAVTLNSMIEGLETSFHEMQQFTADAAHELRTPLTIIRNEAEVALRQPRTPEDYRHVLENMLEETVRLTHLAEQLLYLSREDAGLQSIRKVPLRLDELLYEVVEQMRVVAEEKHISVLVGTFLPSQSLGDPERLRRVLFNVLDNAIKYTPERGMIRVSCESSSGRIRLTVADSGVGIPPQHLPNVFNRFYRVDAARSGNGNGTGLGLAISRAIVEAHSGTIELSSEPGRGTQVALTFAESTALNE